MKHRFKLLLIGIAVAATGCLSNKASSPVPTPVGTFSGQFRSVHVKSDKSGFDTLKANIILTTTSNTFKITGDTATLHAGSYGSFGLNSVYLNFVDATVGTSKTIKVHLNGLYQYYYDGSIFQFAASNDTLSYQYDLKRN